MGDAVMNSVLRLSRQMSPVRETYPPSEKPWSNGLRFKAPEPKYSDYYILNSPQRKSLELRVEASNRLKFNSADRKSTTDIAKEVLKTLETSESVCSAKKSPFKEAKSPFCSSPSQFSRYSGRDMTVSTAASKKVSQDSMQQVHMSFDDDYSPLDDKLCALKEKSLKSEAEYNARVRIIQENIEKYEKLIQEEAKKQAEEKKIWEKENKKSSYEELVGEVGLLKEENNKLRKVIEMYKKNEDETMKGIKEKISELNRRLSASIS
ncbi:unnamed protein product [Blepharisma stoltei]|uniref:Uncharacterized protein n=1 Tax=Blepharisma stoltei TaxID=1481888 RepID=A0AAU9J8Z8_9CILI|nr:unnamed protein product [Blepharisma stoltei]